jgi:TolB-like protein
VNRPGPLERLRQRGVLRVAFSYAVIAWLLLQIGDVVFEPLNAPAWAMRTLIATIAVGFPLALVLAWYFELGPGGLAPDHLPDPAARPRVRGIRRYADVLIIALLTGVILLLLARQEGLLEPSSDQPVIAVLPFTDLADAQQSYLGDGLADTLIHRLGQVAGLVVLASSSTFEFRSGHYEAADLARKLRADVILEGSLQRTGDALRVNARLVEAATGVQRWSATFDRRATDLFVVQDEIASAVTAALEVVLAPREQRRLTTRETSDLAAYETYLRGREAIAMRTQESLTAGVEYLQNAVASDPGFALAHAALAEAYFLASAYLPFDMPWEDVTEAARVAADRARALDPGLGDAWLAAAQVAMADNTHIAPPPWNPEHIRGLLERAVELSPNSAQAWKFYAGVADNPSDNLSRLEKAAQLDPRSGIILVNLAGAYQERGDMERAWRWYQLSIGTSRPYFELGATALIQTYFEAPGGLAMAARWARALVDINPDEFGAGWREYCRSLIELGAWDEAARELQRAEASEATARPPALLWRLGLAVRLLRVRGDLQTAAEYAERFEQEFVGIFGPRAGAIAIDGPPAVILDALAIRELSLGRAQAVLERTDRLYPGIADLLPGPAATAGLNVRLLRAAALKQSGQQQAAVTDLHSYLAAMAAAHGQAPAAAGFAPFAAHALLGETELALSALEKAVDAGFTHGWWGLKDGVFDPDYATTLADPRVAAQLLRIESMVSAQRAAFRAEPGLPLEERITAGLAGVADTRKP